MDISIFNNLRFEYSLGSNVLMCSLVDTTEHRDLLVSTLVTKVIIEYSHEGNTYIVEKDTTFHCNSIIFIIPNLTPETEIQFTPYIVYIEDDIERYKIQLTNTITDTTLPYGNIEYIIIPSGEGSEINDLKVENKIKDVVKYINEVGTFVDTTYDSHGEHLKNITVLYNSSTQTASAYNYKGGTTIQGQFRYGLVQTSGGSYAVNHIFFHELRHRYGITSITQSLSRDLLEGRSASYSYIQDKYSIVHNALKFETGRSDAKVWIFGAHSNILEGSYTDNAEMNYLAANYIKALCWYGCHSINDEDTSKIRIIEPINLTLINEYVEPDEPIEVEYNISIVYESNHGTVQVSHNKSLPGTQITISNLSLDEGWEFESMTIRCNGENILSTSNDEPLYSGKEFYFDMPEGDVIITIGWSELVIPIEPDDPEEPEEVSDNHFYLSTLIRPYFIDKTNKVYLTSDNYNNDFINKSLNITLYPYEDIINNVYTIHPNIISSTTVINDENFYFRLSSKLGFVNGYISLINQFIFPGKLEEKNYYSSVQEAEEYEKFISKQIVQYYNSYYIYENIENIEREDYLEEIDVEEIRTTGFYIQFATDVNFKEIVYESKINTDNNNDNFIYDFSFSLNKLFDSWNQLNEILVVRSTFIDKRLGIFIRGNNVIITKEWFKYFINDTNDGQIIYTNQNNLITSNFMDVNKGFNLINNINCVIQDKESKTTQSIISETNTNTKIVYKPIFYKVQDLQNIRLHQGVTQNIGINLGTFLTKVETFILNINGKNYKESARNDVFVIFSINSNNIEENSGYYNILDQNFEYISSGIYTLY